MNTITQFFVFTVFMVNSIQCNKRCDCTDVPCTTKGLNRMYKTLIDGAEGRVETSDPLKVDRIEGALQTMQFIGTNITMLGLHDCTITKLTCNSADLVGEFIFQCPQIIIHWEFEAIGVLHGVHLDGSGTGNTTIDNYLITYKFQYDKYIDENDKQQHLSLKNGEVTSQVKEKLALDSAYLRGDREIFDAVKHVLNSEWRETETMLQKPVFDVLLNKFVHNLDENLKLYPIDVLVAEE